MHELSVTQSIVDVCCERANGSRVVRVTLEVGSLSCISPDSLQFCYDVCTRGTVLEGSELEIIPVPVQAQCRACGKLVQLREWLAACDCGAIEFNVCDAGDDLIIRSMEVR